MLTFAAAFILRWVGARALPDLPLSVPAWYLPLTGAGWGIAGLGAACGLFTGRPWAVGLTRWGAWVFLGWYWADRLFVVRAQDVRRALPLSAAVSALGLAGLLWALRRPAVREFFMEKSR